MWKTIAVLSAGVLFEVSGRSADDPSPSRAFVHSLVSKGAFIKSGGSATYGEIRNSPHEWGRTIGGFVKRFGSSVGQRVVKESIQFGINAWRHEDLRYQRSELDGKMARVKYAVVHTFVVPRRGRPGRTPAFSRIAGDFGAGLVSRFWMPTRVATLGAGFASGGTSIGTDLGVNLLREFWPRRNKPKKVIK